MAQHSGSLGVLAANNLGFGLALAEICQTFAFCQRQCQEDMTCPKLATQNFPSMVTSLILDPYGGNELAQQWVPWCAGCKQPWFWLGSA
jgi:hypothetical protein